MLHRCSAEQIQAPHPALALGKQSWSSCPLGRSAGGPPPGQVEGGCSRGATRDRSPQQRAPAAHTWHLQFSPHVPPSVAPSFNFEVLHQVRELRYDTRARAVNPNLVNRRTDFGSPRQFTKNKGGITKNSCWLQSHTDGRGTVRAALLSNFADLACHQAWQTLVF